MARKDSESSSCSDHSHEEENETLSNETVLTKYSVAADVVNSVLKEVLAAVKEGVEVGSLCDLGDKLIREKTSTVYKKEKDLQKGIAMPTCVSVDNCICHFSPLRSEAPQVLKNGQVVKIDLGAHIDGYIATAAHTVVVGATQTNKVSGDVADLLKATYEGMEVAIRMLRPGTQNTAITDAIGKVAAEYGVTPIENMLSHQLERHEIGGTKQIIQNPGEKQKQELEKTTIDKHEVYAIDIMFSTGKGKPKDFDTRTTVFKRNDDVQYSLKMKASRIFMAECRTKNGSMPFSLRSFDDEVKAKLGVVECEKHGLVQPYQVLYEKQGDLVAQFKATVIVMPNGLTKIAGLPLDTSLLNTEKELKDEALVQTLRSAMKPKKKKAKKDDEKEPTAAPVKA